ncbi:hypothetical protein [Cognatishimia sp. MH4019]|uniref:hypothetical protein n=1 Tax=Cognatishimia sp. MH4019 TaxID=2854030 RepID=UPI001CD529D1|nr:hypothetical protein [Cognatishimia sp. MH4019]
MNNSTVKENDAYKEGLAEIRWKYETFGKNTSERAYEYGTLVIKNAFLVSGGGLFFIPAMLGMSSELNVEYAFLSGIFFFGSVVLALVSNFLIYINFSLLERSGEAVFDLEKIYLRRNLSREFETDKADEAELIRKYNSSDAWIFLSYWLPIIFAFLFLASLFFGAYFLYLAFGLTWEGKQ